MTEYGLRALNTYDAAHSTLRKTQVRTWFKQRRGQKENTILYIARQYDFVFSSAGPKAQAGVPVGWKPTDHYPIIAITNFAEGEVVKLEQPKFPRKGWNPKTWRDEETFKKIVHSFKAHLLGSRLLINLDAALQEAVNGVEGLPSGLRKWARRQPGNEELSKKFEWRTTREMGLRTEKHREYIKCREERLRKVAVEDLRCLAKTEGRGASKHVELVFAGAKGFSREDMNHSLRTFLEGRAPADEDQRERKRRQLRGISKMRALQI